MAFSITCYLVTCPAKGQRSPVLGRRGEEAAMVSPQDVDVIVEDETNADYNSGIEAV